MEDYSVCHQTFGEGDGNDGLLHAAHALCSLFMPFASLLADADRLSLPEALRRLTTHLREYFACGLVRILVSTDSGANIEDMRELASFAARRIYDTAMPLNHELFPAITGSRSPFQSPAKLLPEAGPREGDILSRISNEDCRLIILSLDENAVGLLVLANLPASVHSRLSAEEGWLASRLSELIARFISQQRRRLLSAIEARLLHAFSDELPYGACILSGDPATAPLLITEVNPAACHLLGYSKDELLHQPVSKIQDPEATRDTLERISKLTDSHPHIWEGRLSRHNTGVFPAEMTASRMRISGEDLILLVCRDITQRHRTEQALRDSEERYALAARATNDGLWDWDLASGVVYYGQRWYEMLGYTSRDIRPDLDTWYDLVHNEDLPRLKSAIAAHLQGESECIEVEYRIRHKDGGWRWMICHGLAVRDQAGAVTRVAGSQSDITQRKHAEFTLLHDAFHDPLTNLPNRSLFMDRLKLAMARSRRSNDSGFAILYIDIDRFKLINDSLGHSGGDALLVRVAARLQAYLRSEDTLARLGGDEFAILFESVQSIVFATRLSRRIQKALSLPIVINHSKIYPTISIGLTMYQQDYTRPEEMLRDAETAMYRAKAAGGARYIVFDKGMHSQALHALQVENDLRLALKNHEFELFFQPMVALPERRIKGFEALIRWRHPTRGLVSPLDFIPTAEETGLIISIGEWVLTQACEHISAWRLDGHTDIHVAINFSARQFENRNMLDLVGAVMQRTGTPPQALEIEITETVAMKNYDTSIHLLNELHGMGIRISIDDFGTGYSSLGYLKHFPINMLKIDRSFVNDIPGSREDMSITRAIIAMARSLGLDIIAEGVETPEQLAFLEEAGCNFIQGFLFGQPLDARTATTLLEQGLPAIN